ncbi:MAG: hypothetical protein R2827_13185 [Bdellovibrionales bacterium]
MKFLLFIMALGLSVGCATQRVYVSGDLTGPRLSKKHRIFGLVE